MTSINPVRQKEQAIIKQALDQLGFRTELRQVDAAVYFDGSPGNEQNINHFYNDLQMYTNNATTPIPIAYMIGWYAGEDGENIAQRRTTGTARTTAATRTRTTMNCSSRCAWRRTSGERRRCSSN